LHLNTHVVAYICFDDCAGTLAAYKYASRPVPTHFKFPSDKLSVYLTRPFFHAVVR